MSCIAATPLDQESLLPRRTTSPRVLFRSFLKGSDHNSRSSRSAFSHGTGSSKTTKSSKALLRKIHPQRTNAPFIRHRFALRRAGLSGPFPTSELRQLGTTVLRHCKLTETVDALHVPTSYMVRVHDVEGRLLSVEGDNASVSPIAARIAQNGVNVHDGCGFFLRLLSEPHAWNSGMIRHEKDWNFVPHWRQYAFTAALYVSLADAGYFDQSLPFLSLQSVDWAKLLDEQMHLHLDLMSSGSIAREPSRRPQSTAYNSNMNGTDSDGKHIPVAVLLPVTLKGKLRRPLSKKHSATPPPISTQPFSDAEVFQLLYLQLVFRAVLDLRFPTMTIGDGFLRSDWIGLQSSGRQALAFQHPSASDRWLLFPARSKVLHLLALEEAVVPYFASKATLAETAQQRLFGATPLLPCLGATGRSVIVDWAMHQVISSPYEAAIALEELFNRFDASYGVRRVDVWRTPNAPRVYRSGGNALSRLCRDSNDLVDYFALTRSAPSRTQAPRPLTPTPPASPFMTDAVFTLPMEYTKEKEEREEKLEDPILHLWREYIRDGDTTRFVGSTENIEIVKFLGRGGSGLVYEGLYGPQRRPVAVKCLIIPDGMTHDGYVRDSLTNVAFAVLFNQLENCQIGWGTRVYECVISTTPPQGLPAEDVLECVRRTDPATTALCYVVVELMDGTLGRFLMEDEEGYEPFYDTLINSPLRDGEFFQFVYMQLVLRALFDYIVLDLMLNCQLRGDNMGYRAIKNNKESSLSGIIAIFQENEDTPAQYLRFPANPPDATSMGPLRFICFIDVGQGMQPSVQRLTQRGLIGETLVDSCLQDDGLRRYWPLDKIYSRYVETKGSVAREAVQWGAELSVDSSAAAESALRELFALYAPTYGIPTPTAEELASHALLAWTPAHIKALKNTYIYADQD